MQRPFFAAELSLNCASVPSRIHVTPPEFPSTDLSVRAATGWRHHIDTSRVRIVASVVQVQRAHTHAQQNMLSNAHLTMGTSSLILSICVPVCKSCIPSGPRHTIGVETSTPKPSQNPVRASCSLFVTSQVQQPPHSPQGVCTPFMNTKFTDSSVCFLYSDQLLDFKSHFCHHTDSNTSDM